MEMLEKSQEFLKKHQQQVAKAESDALHYKEVTREQEEQKVRSQVNLLNNQVKSLKQIVEIMEKEISRPSTDSIEADFSP